MKRDFAHPTNWDYLILIPLSLNKENSNPVKDIFIKRLMNFFNITNNFYTIKGVRPFT